MVARAPVGRRAGPSTATRMRCVVRLDRVVGARARDRAPRAARAAADELARELGAGHLGGCGEHPARERLARDRDDLGDEPRGLAELVDALAQHRVEALARDLVELRPCR